MSKLLKMSTLNRNEISKLLKNSTLNLIKCFIIVIFDSSRQSIERLFIPYQENVRLLYWDQKQSQNAPPKGQNEAKACAACNKTILYIKIIVHTQIFFTVAAHKKIALSKINWHCDTK